MGVRVGGHLGPVYASKSVSGKGCGLWFLLAIPVGLVAIYWYVALPVAAIIVLSIVAIKVRDDRRRKAIAAHRNPRPMPRSRTQPYRPPILYSPPRPPQPPQASRPEWMGRTQAAYPRQPTFTPHPPRR